ncbi:Threonine synthase [Euzebya pacifica]|uniref:Threonine synthase n=1 Tax=Euzebya pacifica TaxID=1608957 RepID=A0A346Y170_9ACTN|nr:pyridoxal-phosphate dependent enzyme [Euzebya pacifica]AXV08217.1 Threonine synthase [Euzebya pacifica]
MPMTKSHATGQRSLKSPELQFPLLPPLTKGCPTTSTATVSYPLEVTYDLSSVRGRFPTGEGGHAPMTAWTDLLPPVAEALAADVGGTPLIDGGQALDATIEVWLKDESRNPTWSHKDRLNVCTVSAGSLVDAPGIVVASSGNHGASAAAMAARLGLPCVVVMSSGSPPAVAAFVEAYGATTLCVHRDARWQLLNDLVDRLGFHPVSNMTPTHTGHPFGPEGYKTIAFEVVEQLGGRVPAEVYVPTGYAELLYGVWKGFKELEAVGVTDTTPRMMACEVAVRGPLARSIREGLPATTVEGRPTDAYSMATTTSGYRGVLAVTESGGEVVLVDDEQMYAAQARLAGLGLWQELSGASALAGLTVTADRGHRPDGPVVCICTSSGFKDKTLPVNGTRHEIDASWPAVRRTLKSSGIAA